MLSAVLDAAFLSICLTAYGLHRWTFLYYCIDYDAYINRIMIIILYQTA